MKKTVYFVLDYYNKQIVGKIAEKYSLSPMEASKRFLTSETHALLEDETTGLTEFPPDAVFDMWEVEQMTGNPRNSVYVRAE